MIARILQVFHKLDLGLSGNLADRCNLHTGTMNTPLIGTAREYIGLVDSARTWPVPLAKGVECVLPVFGLESLEEFVGVVLVVTPGTRSEMEDRGGFELFTRPNFGRDSPVLQPSRDFGRSFHHLRYTPQPRRLLEATYRGHRRARRQRGRAAAQAMWPMRTFTHEIMEGRAA